MASPVASSPPHIASLAVALIDLLRDPARADALGQQGAQHVAAYDAPRIAAQFMEAIMPVPNRANR